MAQRAAALLNIAAYAARLLSSSLDYFFMYGDRTSQKAPIASRAKGAEQTHPDHRRRHARHLRTARASPAIDHATARRLRRAASRPHQGAPRPALAWYRGGTLALAASRQ